MHRRRLHRLVTEALAAQREVDARIAANPYSDQVNAMGNDEPFAVGTKIAAAIRAQETP